jgi:two-component sensor histidine kinase
VVVLGNEDSAEATAEADAFLERSPEPQALLRLVQSQVRVAQQIAELETSRASLLSAAMLSMQLTQSMRSELGMQQTLHHELLHRVQTHIGALRDYLDLEVRRLPLGIAREAMRGVFYRVRNLSSMYDTMAMLAMNEVVDFGQLAEKISQGVKAMYSPRSKLPVVVEGQLFLPSTSASPLTLVVNELVTNAYKHAFPGGRFGTIHISCGQEDDKAWCTVSDDGVGVDLPLKTRPNSGVHLVRQLVRRTLGGECSWQRSDQGTIAKVQFPLAAP